MIRFLPKPVVDPTRTQPLARSKIIPILNPFAIKPHHILPKPKHTKRRRTAGRHLSCCDPSPPLGKTVTCSFKIKTHFVN